MRKPVFGVYDQVRHKPGCTTIEDGKRLEILVVEGLYYPWSENKGYREADLGLCFAYAKIRFSHDAAHVLQW